MSRRQVFLTALEAHSPTCRSRRNLHLPRPRSTSLQRLVRRPRLSALGRCAGDAIERARGRVADAGQGARRAGRRRGSRRLYRRRDGASGLHRALSRRSRAAGPARSADGGQDAFRRSRRARARSGLAALLRRAFRRCRRRPAERPAAPAEGGGAVHSRRRRHSRRARAAAGDHGLRRGQAAPRHRQGLRRERHAGDARPTRFPARPCSTNGSAIAGATAPSR